MTIDDFLNTYKNTMLNKKTINPLSSSNTGIANSKLGFQIPKRNTPQTSTFGSQVPDWLSSRESSAIDSYMQKKSDITSDLASRYSDKAAGQVPTNEWGIVQDKMTNFSDYFNNQLGAIDNIGKSKLATDQAKAQWQSAQNQAEMNAGYAINYTPGASGNNPGAKAVQIALNARGVPYRWGGNSLTSGVDCSGLVQQVYHRLGINLPRTTYEQARSGKQVSLGNLLPGDLVFYNTGSGDPNGIGSLSHVAIYIGNGRVIDAPGRNRSVRITSIRNAGRPARAVRPW